MTESGTNETPEKTKLFVGGLQSSNGGCVATEEELITYFNTWGPVLSFALIKDQQQRFKGYGFVTFESAESASNCLNFSTHTYDNKPISVKPCNDKQNRRPYNGRINNSPGYQNQNQFSSNRYSHMPHQIRFNGPRGPIGNYAMPHPGPDPRMGYHHQQQYHHHHQQHQSESDSIKSNSSNKKKTDDELQVFVGGLPSNANEQDLIGHFEKFGLIEHVSVAKDKNGGDGHKGFAFITFQDKQSREHSLKQSEHRINQRIVKVEPKRPSANRRENINRHHSQNRGAGSYNPSPRSQKGNYERMNGRTSVENRVENGISPDQQSRHNYPQVRPQLQGPIPINPQLISHGQYQMVPQQQINSYHPIYQPSQQPMIYNQHHFNHYQIGHPSLHHHHIQQFMNQQHDVYPYMIQPHPIIQPMMMPHPHVPQNQPPISQSPQSGQSGGYYLNHPGLVTLQQPMQPITSLQQQHQTVAQQHQGATVSGHTPPQQGKPSTPNESQVIQTAGRSPSTH